MNWTNRILLAGCVIGVALLGASPWAASGDPETKQLREGAYTLVKTPVPSISVRGVNIRALAEQTFPEHELYRENVIGPWGRRLALKHRASQAKAYLMVAVYRSVQEAEVEALGFLNSASAVYKRHSNAGIGDSGNSWLFERDGRANIVFLRRNVLVEIAALAGCSKDDVERKCRLIDSEILSGGRAIELGKKAPEPIIRRVCVPSFIRIGERDWVDIQAQAPKIHELSLNIICSGTTAEAGEQPGRFEIEGKTTGKHTFLVAGVTKECVVGLWRGEIWVEPPLDKE